MREKVQKLSGTVQSRTQLKLERRRMRVAELLSQSYSESQIAKELQVSVSSVSRDISALREQSQQFVNDLARSNLAFYYKQCLNGLQAVKREAWEHYRNNGKSMKSGEKLAYLRLIKECDSALFSMIQEGPSQMALRALEEKMAHLEQSACQDQGITRDAMA